MEIILKNIKPLRGKSVYCYKKRGPLISECSKCKEVLTRKNLKIDYIVPIELGGSYEDFNIRQLCKFCFIEKKRFDNVIINFFKKAGLLVKNINNENKIYCSSLNDLQILYKSLVEMLLNYSNNKLISREQHVDFFNKFIEEVCIVDNNQRDIYYLLYKKFNIFLEKNNIKILTKREFGALLTLKGYKYRVCRIINQTGRPTTAYYVFGLQLKDTTNL